MYKYIDKSKGRFKKIKNQSPQYQTSTREILQLALDFVVRNKNMKMSEYSEWEDLFHLIVPVSYCDIVLVDRRCKAFLSQTGFSFPEIAMTFDKHTIEDFFKEIENWNLPTA